MSINVLIPDGESDLSLEVIRCLQQEKTIKIHVISSLKWVESHYSKYIESFSVLPNDKGDMEWVKNVLNYLQKNKINVLIPVYVEKIKIISQHKELFKQITKLIIPDIKSFEIANNKKKLSLFLEKNKISQPKSYLVNQKNNLEFPLIYKPVDKFGGIGIKKINNRKEFDAISKFEYNIDKYIIQNYIEGYDIDMSVLCDDGKILAFTIQKPILYGKSPYQPSLGIEFLYENKIYSIVEELMLKLNWSGVAHVDLRYDYKEKEFKIIEINPRYWGSVGASNKMGVNFPFLHCLTSKEIKFKIPIYKQEKFFKNRGLLKIIKMKFLLKNSKYKIPKNSSLTSDLLDPLPKTYKYTIKTLKKIFSKNSKFLSKFKYEVY